MLHGRVGLGDLTEVVHLQEATRTDVEGFSTDAWANVATDPVMYVHFDWRRGQSLIRNGKIEARAAAVMTGHWRSDMTSANRVLYIGDSKEVLRFFEDPQRLDEPHYSAFFEVLVYKTDTDPVVT